jgi:tRNA (cytidine/uridine-2'-O-)-methyltransferase
MPGGAFYFCHFKPVFYMLHVILYQPEIPPNTGNIIRLCANTGAHLHLVGPLGFQLDNSRVKRAGLDYADMARVRQYVNWDEFRAQHPAMTLWAFSTRGKISYAEAEFHAGDGLLFGPETRGLPESVLEQAGREHCLHLPMRNASRSLNLSNTVAVGLYEAWRQLEFRDC